MPVSLSFCPALSVFPEKFAAPSHIAISVGFGTATVLGKWLWTQFERRRVNPSRALKTHVKGIDTVISSVYDAPDDWEGSALEPKE